MKRKKVMNSSSLQSKLPPPVKLQVAKSNRDKLVLEYQEKRESGLYQEALQAFLQIAEFDKNNKDYKKYVDVLGHIRICYKLIADQCAENKNTKCAKENYQNALETIETALKIAKREKFTPKETAITKVHYASTVNSLSKYLKGTEKTKTLNKALKNINSAIKNLPGSNAHKAWPMSTKAKILHLLGKDKEAIETLTKAETYILLDKDELKNKDGLMKILIWKSGLDLVKAEILISKARKCRNKMRKPGYLKLAESYLNSVLALPEIRKSTSENDPLFTRRMQAKGILENVQR